VYTAAFPSFRSRSNAAEQGVQSFRREESGSNIRYSPSGLPVGQLSGKFGLPGVQPAKSLCFIPPSTSMMNLLQTECVMGMSCHLCSALLLS